MTVYITFTSFGTDVGPFNLFSNVDGYANAFAAGVSKAQLLAGFPSNSVPNGTTIVRAKSFGVCNNFVDLVLIPASTTTAPPTTAPPTTIPPTTAPPTTAPPTTAPPLPTFRAWHFSSPGRSSSGLACNSTSFTNTWYTNYQTGITPAMGSTLYSSSALTNPPINGANLWFNLKEAFDDGNPVAYQIGTGGTLNNFFNCP
jgi:hypothetical protein